MSVPLNKELLTCIKLSTYVSGCRTMALGQKLFREGAAFIIVLSLYSANLHKLIGMPIEAMLEAPFHSDNVKGP